MTRNDIDTKYMGNYNMRLIKIFNKDAQLKIDNVELSNSGISDDVDFNPMLIEHVENSPIRSVIVSSKLERILLDPSLSLDNAANLGPAYSAFAKFCERPQRLVES